MRSWGIYNEDGVFELFGEAAEAVGAAEAADREHAIRLQHALRYLDQLADVHNVSLASRSPRDCSKDLQQRN